MSYQQYSQQGYPSQAPAGQWGQPGMPPPSGQQQWGGQPQQQQWGGQPQPQHGGAPPGSQQQWGGQPQQQQWGGQPQGGHPPATGQPPQQQWGGQPQPQHGGAPPGSQQQWGGQPQQQWAQPQPGGAPPGSQGMPGPPPSGFQGWYTQYYHQMNPQELQQVRQWFTSMDRDRSGSISANELANVAIAGVPIGFETAVRLIRVFDVDRNGTIDFYEYGALHKFLLSMQALFQQQDRDRNGKLDANEISQALAAGGFRLAPLAAQSIYRKYNKSGYGVSMVEFLGLVAHVALVKSVFEWRDKQKTGQVTLDMNGLIEITSDF